MIVLNVLMAMAMIMFLTAVTLLLAAIAWYLIEDTHLGNMIRERIRRKHGGNSES